jgi:hypothetical protein
MSYFYGSIEGNAKTQATRIGTKNSGMISHTRSWNKGVKVVVVYDKEQKQNVFNIYETKGSLNSGDMELIARVTEDV